MTRYYVDATHAYLYGCAMLECPEEIVRGGDEAVIPWLINKGYPEHLTEATFFRYRLIQRKTD